MKKNDLGLKDNIKHPVRIVLDTNLSLDLNKYKFFKETEKKFLYIDRIAIDKNFRRQGFGEDLYKLIGSITEYENIPLCCEVNVKPMNHISVNFHKKQGFKKVGSGHFKDHSVAYFKK